jgi:hypothetical protein
MSKTQHAPKVTSKRAQRTLHHALARAEAVGDKKRADHVKALLNGATAMPVPNLKKVKVK